MYSTYYAYNLINENKKENVEQRYGYSQYTTQYFHDILTHFRDV